jgi:hypothetical protein
MAARVRGVCKALRGVMNECPVELGDVRSHTLKDALTYFPAAPSLHMVIGKKLPASRKSKLVQVLRQHGDTLKRVTAEGDIAEQVLESTLRAGGLPKLTYFKMIASCPEHGQWLSDGRLRPLEEVHVGLSSADDLPALGHLRQLLHLRSLEIEGENAPVPEAVFPAFIPPSLKTLTLDHLHGPLLESLLLQLPSMLQASGTGLVELKVISAATISEESGVALARVLQSCSSTLKTFRIVTADVPGSLFERDFGSEVALGLESCCEGLERLEVPWEVFKNLPPTCPAFTRLTHLTFKGDAAPIDLSSPVWDRVASGLLPALADLHLEANGLWWGNSWRYRGFLRALEEGVAGTLRRLTLQDESESHSPHSATCHELGVAIGKMRRLTYLSLRLTRDGKSCLPRRGAGPGGIGGLPTAARAAPERSQPECGVPRVGAQPASAECENFAHLGRTVGGGRRRASAAMRTCADGLQVWLDH